MGLRFFMFRNDSDVLFLLLFPQRKNFYYMCFFISQYLYIYIEIVGLSISYECEDSSLVW